MAHNSKHNPAAGHYAQAILELAIEQKQAEPIGQELREIKDVLAANPTFELFLKDPAIGENERGQVLHRIFDGHVSPLLSNAIGVMNRKGRIGILAEVADAYHGLLDKHLGRVNVDVTVAQPLDEAAVAQVAEQIRATFKKTAQIRQLVDDSILGGMVLRIEDRLIDGSVKGHLDAMRRKLMEGVVAGQ